MQIPSQDIQRPPQAANPQGRYAVVTRCTIFLALMLLIGGCGQTSAAKGEHSYVSETEGSIYRIGWDGNGSGTIQGSLDGTFYDEDEYEVDEYEESFVGTAESDFVTIESGEYGTLNGRVDEDTLTIEYEGEDGIEERVYQEASLEEYERAAAEFQAKKEALADASREVGETADEVSEAAQEIEYYLDTEDAPLTWKVSCPKRKSWFKATNRRLKKREKSPRCPRSRSRSARMTSVASVCVWKCPKYLLQGTW